MLDSPMCNVLIGRLKLLPLASIISSAMGKIVVTGPGLELLEHAEYLNFVQK